MGYKNMKRFIGILTFIICILLILSTCKKYESKENNEIIDYQKNSITIKYEHSMRIPHHQIICTLIEKNNNSYIMNVETIAMISMVEYEKDNIKFSMEIEEDFFHNIYKKLLEIDLVKLVQEEEDGLDGYSVTIEFNINQERKTIDVWCPSLKSGEAKKVSKIVLEVFKKANVSQWY